jgi:hypothetical protein
VQRLEDAAAMRGHLLSASRKNLQPFANKGYSQEPQWVAREDGNVYRHLDAHGAKKSYPVVQMLMILRPICDG